LQADSVERQRMIQEAALSLYERGALIHGHDVDDWIAAEAYVDRRLADRQAEPRKSPVPSAPGRAVRRRT
jgi:hypothetical protein